MDKVRSDFFRIIRPDRNYPRYPLSNGDGKSLVKLPKMVGLRDAGSKVFSGAFVNSFAKGLHPHRSSTGLNQLASSIKKLSRQRRLHVQPYSIEQLKAALCPAEKTNKRLLAEQVAAQYPVLRHDFEKERANRNPYYLRMFEAVALGMRYTIVRAVPAPLSSVR